MGFAKFEQMITHLMNLEWDSLPSQVIERAKWIIYDTTLVMLYGLALEESQQFIAQNGSASSGEGKNIFIPYANKYFTPYDACLLLGTAVVNGEMDEGSQFAKGHPAAHILPVLFVKSQLQPVSSQDFIRSFIIAYEIATRLGYASHMRDDMHPHGTWGIVGGAVGSALLAGESKQHVIAAACLAGSLPLATSWEAAVGGYPVRNLYTGLGNAIAYETGKLIKSGFSSDLTVVEHVWSQILSDACQSELFVEKMDEKFYTLINYFKLYPACRFSHSSIEAFRSIEGIEHIQPADIDRIVVGTYSLAARLNGKTPDNLLAAKFSVPFLLSASINGYTLFEADSSKLLFHEGIRETAGKIDVIPNEEMSRQLPHKRPASVTVYLNGGKQRLEGYVDNPVDAFQSEKSFAMLLEKHRQLALRIDLSKQMNDFRSALFSNESLLMKEIWSKLC